MNLRTAALRGAIWNALENVGTQLTSFVVFLVLARLIAPEAFGVLSMAATVLALLMLLVEQGFSMVLIQTRELHRSLLDTAFWISVGSAVFLAALLTAMSGWVAHAYDSPVLEPVLDALAWTLPLFALGAVQAALLVRCMSFRVQAMRRLIAVAGSGAVGIGMALADYGVWSLVGKQATEALLDTLLVWRTSDYRPALSFSRSAAAELISFGSRILGSGFVGFLNRRFDDFLIGLVLGPIALGYYSVAFRALLLVTEVALRAAARTALPVFSQLQADPAQLRRAYYRAVELASVVACPVFIGLSATAPELTVSLFGPKWLPIVPAMQVLGYVGLGVSVSLYTGPALISVAKPGWFLYFNLAVAVVNLSASWVAVHWGILAMAWSYVLRGYLVLPLILYTVRRANGSDPWHVLRLLVAPSAASLLMALAVALVRRATPGLPPALTLTIMVAVGAAVYVAVMSLIARTTMARLVELLRTSASAG
jgi:O-antigen/teichoic acid export membrane protein